MFLLLWHNDDLLGDNDVHQEESSRMTSETTELANMSNQIGNLRTQMESTQGKKVASQTELDKVNTQKRDLEQRLQQFRSQYESEVKTVKDLEQKLMVSRESTKQLSRELAMAEGTYRDLQTQHQSVSQQLQADQQENAHAQTANRNDKCGNLETEARHRTPSTQRAPAKGNGQYQQEAALHERERKGSVAGGERRTAG